VKVAFEVGGVKVAAETDYRISPSLTARDQELIGTAMFVRLCNEARAIAKDYIARMPIAAKEGGVK
jgi:hypothetical protein